MSALRETVKVSLAELAEAAVAKHGGRTVPAVETVFHLLRHDRQLLWCAVRSAVLGAAIDRAVIRCAALGEVGGVETPPAGDDADDRVGETASSTEEIAVADAIEAARVRALIVREIQHYGSETKLGAACGVRQVVIWRAKKKGRVSSTVAVKLEAGTGGRLARWDLRPDLWDLPPGSILTPGACL